RSPRAVETGTRRGAARLARALPDVLVRTLLVAFLVLGGERELDRVGPCARIFRQRLLVPEDRGRREELPAFDAAGVLDDPQPVLEALGTLPGDRGWPLTRRRLGLRVEVDRVVPEYLAEGLADLRRGLQHRDQQRDHRRGD